jgi:hypothetical protein
MASPNLTKIMIGMLIGTCLFGILFNIYIDFGNRNGLRLDEPYKSAMEKISGSYSQFSEVAGQASQQSLVTNIYNAGKNAITGTVNIFVVGLDALGMFFNMIPLIGDILQAIALVFPQFNILIGLLMTITALYIAMRYIQSASNKFDTP